MNGRRTLVEVRQILSNLTPEGKSDITKMPTITRTPFLSTADAHKARLHLSTPGPLQIRCRQHPWVVRVRAYFHSMYSSELAAINTVIEIMDDMRADDLLVGHEPFPLISWAKEFTNAVGVYNDLCTSTVLLNRHPTSWLPPIMTRQAELEKEAAAALAVMEAGPLFTRRFPPGVPTNHKDVAV